MIDVGRCQSPANSLFHCVKKERERTDDLGTTYFPASLITIKQPCTSGIILLYLTIALGQIGKHLAVVMLLRVMVICLWYFTQYTCSKMVKFE